MPHHHRHQGGQPDQVEGARHGPSDCAGCWAPRETNGPSTLHCTGAPRLVHLQNLPAETGIQNISNWSCLYHVL